MSTKRTSILVGFFIILGMTLSSCSMFLPETDVTEKSDLYQFKFKKDGWKEIDPDKSDHAFIHKESNSILVLNSMCKKYEASSYQHLTENILSGFEDIKYEQEQDIKIFSRKGKQIRVKASLDGISTFFQFVSVRKDRCLYDFLLITNSPEKRIKMSDDFKDFINSVNIR